MDRLGNIPAENHRRASDDTMDTRDNRDFFWDRPVPRLAVEEALERNLRGDKCVLFVEGPCGVGKSRLVRDAVQRHPHVSLIAAHYDSLQRSEPYVALIPALNEFLATQISNVELHERIRKSLGTGGSVLLPLLPILHSILEPSLELAIAGSEKQRKISDSSTSTKNTSVASNEPSPPKSNANGNSVITTTKRFPYVFLFFLRAIASLNQPVVLLIENAHNVDASSVRALHRISRDIQQCPGLVLAFTFDPQKFQEKHKFKMEKMDLEFGGSAEEHEIVHVKLNPLDSTEIKNCLQLYLQGDVDDAMVEYLMLCSRGVMFHFLELTNGLVDRSEIERNEGNSWALRRPAVKPDIASYLLQQLSAGAVELVKAISCFGGTLKSHLLDQLIPNSYELVLEGIGHHVVVKKRDNYCIRHHVLHSAVYFDHMTGNERAKMHLQLGKRLLDTFSFAALEHEIFMVLTHFHFSESLLELEEDRHHIARLCLLAGRKAAAISAFRTASLHLGLAIRLLGDSGWRDRYDLTLACHNAAAEMSLLILDHETTDDLIATVRKRARHDLDRLQAETTRVYSLGMANKQNEAIDLGMELLGRLGERIPPCFCNLQVLWNSKQLSWLMRGKTDADLLNLPPMTDPKKLMCMQILNLLFLHAFLARPKIVLFVTMKTLSLTLKYGSSLIAPIGLAMYGMAQIHMGNFDGAYRFGWLAMKLLEKQGHDASLPRVYLIFYGCIQPLARPIKEAHEELLKAYYTGLQTGDYEFACLNANVYLSKTFDSSCSLEKVGNDWTRMRSVMEVLGQKTMLEMMEPMIQNIHRLLGQPHETTGTVAYDAERAYKLSMENQMENVGVSISVNELVISVLLNDFDASRTHVNRLESRFSIHHPEDVELACVFLSVAALELVSRAMFNKRSALQFIKRTIRVLTSLSLRCPANFLHTRLFLEAELAAFHGQERQAFENYCGAIATSSEHFMSNAFFTERAARFLVKFKRYEESSEYFDLACTAYNKWGAFAKVMRLEAECKQRNLNNVRWNLS